MICFVVSCIDWNKKKENAISGGVFDNDDLFDSAGGTDKHRLNDGGNVAKSNNDYNIIDIDFANNDKDTARGGLDDKYEANKYNWD